MVFKSKVDWISGGSIALVILFLVGLSVISWFEKPLYVAQTIWLSLLLLSIILFFIWIYTSTHYVIEEETLSYHSGPFNGKIDLKNIRRMEVNKTLYVGTKRPATSLNGIIVYYNKYDEIYISPKDKEGFVKACLAINPAIEVKYF